MEHLLQQGAASEGLSMITSSSHPPRSILVVLLFKLFSFSVVVRGRRIKV
jgi:hypothetical protein